MMVSTISKNVVLLSQERAMAAHKALGFILSRPDLYEDKLTEDEWWELEQLQDSALSVFEKREEGV